MLPLVAFAMLLAAITTPVPADPAPTRVKALFDRMHAGTYRDDFLNPPKLEWADIPALLDRAESTRLLEAFPRNPISSQYERAAPEGVVALWLVEGLRKGGRYASLNARLTTAAGEAKGEAFEGNNKAAAKAYRAWWAKVKDLPPAKAREVDPLEGTGLRWW
jgi:hypothetical protein